MLLITAPTQPVASPLRGFTHFLDIFFHDPRRQLERRRQATHAAQGMALLLFTILFTKGGFPSPRSPTAALPQARSGCELSMPPALSRHDFSCFFPDPRGRRDPDAVASGIRRPLVPLVPPGHHPLRHTPQSPRPLATTPAPAPLVRALARRNGCWRLPVCSGTFGLITRAMRWRLLPRLSPPPSGVGNGITPRLSLPAARRGSAASAFFARARFLFSGGGQA